MNKILSKRDKVRRCSSVKASEQIKVNDLNDFLLLQLQQILLCL